MTQEAYTQEEKNQQVADFIKHLLMHPEEADLIEDQGIQELLGRIRAGIGSKPITRDMKFTIYGGKPSTQAYSEN